MAIIGRDGKVSDTAIFIPFLPHTRVTLTRGHDTVKNEMERMWVT